MTVLLAGGGSGGHISPGLAIAERLIELAPDARAIFACSQRAIDAAMLTEAGAEFIALPATPPSKKPLAAGRFVLNFMRSKRIVRDLIGARNVKRVVALGGFVAAPAASAAASLGVPVMLVNLDAPPGKANQWIARRCDRVVSAIALPAVSRSLPRFASEVVGMPIRRRALAPASQRDCRTHLGLDPNAPTLLVTGASQGAASINCFMTALVAAQPDWFDGWQIYHLAGAVGADGLRAAYEAARLRATVEPFLNEIGLAWGAADLAISRAGASSVAEAAANAVPTLFLPYPYHRDMHQRHNAQPLVDLGGAVLAIDQVDPSANVASIGPLLRALMCDEAKRQAMRSLLRARPPADAALTIARMVV